MNPIMKSEGQQTIGGTTYQVYRHTLKGTVQLVRVTDKVQNPEQQHNNSKRRRIAMGHH